MHKMIWAERICQQRTTITMDDIKLCSYNCKGFSISKIKHIAELLSNSAILLLQETWLLKSQIGTINQYFSEFNTCGISGINENVLIQGRRYGGGGGGVFIFIQEILII